MATQTLRPNGTQSNTIWVPTGEATCHECLQTVIPPAPPYDTTTYINASGLNGLGANCVLALDDFEGSEGAIITVANVRLLYNTNAGTGYLAEAHPYIYLRKSDQTVLVTGELDESADPVVNGISESGLSVTGAEGDGLLLQIITTGQAWTKTSFVKVYAAEVNLTYTPAFTTTHTDYFEFTENYMKTFLERLQDEIEADSTISAYCDSVYVMATGEPSRAQISSGLKDTQIIIHSPSERTNLDVGGSGREDQILECTVTVVVRSGKGIDGTNDREVPLVGDGTSTQPGVLEVQADIESLLHNNGQMNKLESGGEPYLWFLEWGDVEVEASDDKKSEILMAHRKVIGHKWRQNWS